MALSQELSWRGFTNQTTYKDVTAIDGDPITFYFGVDPSADSMTIGNLAAAMMVRHFINYGHKAILLVGGATGLIGDPDGKAQERELKSLDVIAANKAGIVAQYKTIFAGQDFTVVDNYDWFKDMNFLTFLRDTGKHVPVNQMLGRDFVQSRLGEAGAGLSYAEFSYALIQAYDFLHLHRTTGASLQLCGADQWGNSIAGVDLIRRVTGDEAHVWSSPLVINKTTGVKFGKSEDGAVWLDPSKTSPTQFYQFWINCDDAGIEDYLKVYTLLSKYEIDAIITEHQSSPSARIAQKRLAAEVTTLVHGTEQMKVAQQVTELLTGGLTIGDAQDILDDVRAELANAKSSENGSISDALVAAGLASSNGEARRLIQNNAIALNGVKVMRDNFEATDFYNGYLLLRRGKAFKDTALIELN